MTTADVVNTLVSLVTAVGVVFSIAWAIRTGRRDNKESQAAADRAEAAARLQDDQVNRLVDAIDSIDSRAGIAAPAPRVIRWSMTHRSGDTYLLQNDSSALTAHDVTLAHDPSLRLEQPAQTELGPGEATWFVARRTMITTDSTVEVGWTDDHGDAHTWRYPLPPSGSG